MAKGHHTHNSQWRNMPRVQQSMMRGGRMDPGGDQTHNLGNYSLMIDQLTAPTSEMLTSPYQTARDLILISVVSDST